MFFLQVLIQSVVRIFVKYFPDGNKTFNFYRKIMKNMRYECRREIILKKMFVVKRLIHYLKSSEIRQNIFFQTCVIEDKTPFT